MVDPVFVEADPEPDIEEPAIRRRSSQPDLQHPFAPPSHTSQQQSPSATVPLQPPASTPVVTERDFHTPPKSVLTNSTGRTRAPSYPTRDAEDEKAFAVPGGGSSIRPIPTPESVLGLPVHGGHARKENTEGAEGEGLELNRAATNDTLPAHAGHTGDNEADHSDDEKVPEITWKASFKNTIKEAPLVCALPLTIPVAWGLHFSGQSDVAVFVTCLISVIPLAAGISFATEELALRVGEAWGGLLNATFGNAIELLIAIIALVDGQIDIVQASMIGSVLSNLLLVLGCSYFAGGLRFHEQMYAIPHAQMQIGLLGITLMAVSLPAAYHWAYPNTVPVGTIPTGSQPTGVELENLLKISRGLSFILLACYAMFLTFQLYTHAYLFKVPRDRPMHPLPGGPVPDNRHVFPKPNWVSSMGSSDTSSTTSSRDTSGHPFRRFRRFSIRDRSVHEADVDLERGDAIIIDPPAPHATEPEAMEETRTDSPKTRFKLPRVPSIPQRVREPGAPAPLTQAAIQRLEVAEVDPYRQLPVVKFWYAAGMLVVMTGFAGATAEFLVGSIDGMTQQSNISREFIGLILLPVIGNAVEHITAVTVSVKDKLNLSMSIAVGSSIQVSLGILPILVLIGWAIGQPLTLFFDAFETIVLVIAVLLVNFAIGDGRTNYLEGFAMMMAWVAIAVVTFFYDPAR